jgi:hypothetical protein
VSVVGLIDKKEAKLEKPIWQLMEQGEYSEFLLNLGWAKGKGFKGLILLYFSDDLAAVTNLNRLIVEELPSDDNSVVAISQVHKTYTLFKRAIMKAISNES